MAAPKESSCVSGRYRYPVAAVELRDAAMVICDDGSTWFISKIAAKESGELRSGSIWYEGPPIPGTLAAEAGE